MLLDLLNVFGVELAQVSPVGDVWLEGALTVHRSLVLDVQVVPLLLNLLLPFLAPFDKVFLLLPAQGSTTGPL